MATPYSLVRISDDQARAMLGTSLQRSGYLHEGDRTPTYQFDRIDWVYRYDRSVGAPIHVLYGQSGTRDPRDMVSFQHTNQDGRKIKLFYAEDIGTKLVASDNLLNEAARHFRLKGPDLVDLYSRAAGLEIKHLRALLADERKRARP